MTTVAVVIIRLVPVVIRQGKVVEVGRIKAIRISPRKIRIKLINIIVRQIKAVSPASRHP